MSQAINCSSCGAANQIPEGKDSMFCVYCGSSIIKIKQANDHADPTADPKIKNYLELAQNAMEASDFDEAIRYFNKVLESNPKISEAWFGKGYCSGWNGSLKSIKVDQMILNFNKALEYVTEDKLQELKIKVAEAIDGCAFSIYTLSYNHTAEFAQVDDTYEEHLSRSTNVLSALEFAHSINPQSKAIVESLLSISKNLLKPISYTNYDDKLVSHSLDSGSSKKIKEIYNKYFKLMEGIDPEYVNTIKKQEERAKNIKLIGLGVITLFILFLFFNTCNKPNNLSNTENGSDVTNSNTETNSSINDQNVTEPSQYDLLRDAVSGATDSESSASYSSGSMPMKDVEDIASNPSLDQSNYQTNDGSQSSDNDLIDFGSYNIVNLDYSKDSKSNHGDLILTGVTYHEKGIGVGVAIGNQTWELRPSKDGYYYLIPDQAKTKCLDVYKLRIENGGEILAWEQNDGENQKWKIEKISDNKYYIISKLSDKYLGMKNNGVNYGELFIGDFNGKDNQKWIFKSPN